MKKYLEFSGSEEVGGFVEMVMTPDIESYITKELDKVKYKYKVLVDTKRQHNNFFFRWTVGGVKYWMDYIEVQKDFKSEHVSKIYGVTEEDIKKELTQQ